jgi:hypothetical protein
MLGSPISFFFGFRCFNFVILSALHRAPIAFVFVVGFVIAKNTIERGPLWTAGNGDTSEAETEHKRNTHTPSFLMTPKVHSKLLDFQSFKYVSFGLLGFQFHQPRQRLFFGKAF